MSWTFSSDFPSYRSCNFIHNLVLLQFPKDIYTKPCPYKDINCSCELRVNFDYDNNIKKHQIILSWSSSTNKIAQSRKQFKTPKCTSHHCNESSNLQSYQIDLISNLQYERFLWIAMSGGDVLTGVLSTFP